MYKISIEDTFSAAHFLKDYQGKCANVHGHNWKIIVTVMTEKLDDAGIAFDFHDLRTVTRNAVNLLDHKNLNELEYFSYQNPTSENIARLLYTKIQEQLPQYIKMVKVEVIESDGCTITYSEEHYENK